MLKRNNKQLLLRLDRGGEIEKNFLVDSICSLKGTGHYRNICGVKVELKDVSP